MTLGAKIEKILTVFGATFCSVLLTCFLTQGWVWPVVVGAVVFSLVLYLVYKNKHEWLSDILSQIGSHF